MSTNGIPPPSTDPTAYDLLPERLAWAASPPPASPEAWIERAREVAAVLARDAAARERAGYTPRAEIALLKHSGLLRVLGPVRYGGGGMEWGVAYRVVREVAKADGSIGMLLGYHLLWSTTANVVGTAEQAEALQEYIVRNNLFLGGAVNPRDADLRATPTAGGEGLVFHGAKHFCTGGVVSDLTVLEGVVDGTDDHVFTVVRTQQPGIRFAHDWDNIGMRLTESGGVRVENVVVPWSDALGWDVATKRPDPTVLGTPYASLLLPTIQLVFSNFYLGIAQGALDAAAAYTRTHTRPWPHAGRGDAPKPSAVDEFHVLERYGNFHAHLAAADALVDRAAAAAAALYAAYGHDHRDPVAYPGLGVDNRAQLAARQRGEFAELVAAAKVVTTDVGLRVASGVFEVAGSRATAAGVGLDRFWRDLRTHTLHDPVAYKNRELGRWVLLDEVPEVTWYS